MRLMFKYKYNPNNLESVTSNTKTWTLEGPLFQPDKPCIGKLIKSIAYQFRKEWNNFDDYDHFKRVIENILSWRAH